MPLVGVGASAEVADWNSKNMAMNLNRMVDPKLAEHARTVEIRAVRAQMSFDEFLLEISMFQARLQYLARQKDVIPFERRRLPGWPERMERLDACGQLLKRARAR